MEQILGAIVKMPRLRFIKSIFSEQTLIAWMMLVAIIPMLLLAYFAYSSAQATLKDTISSVLLMEIKKKEKLKEQAGIKQTPLMFALLHIN